MPDPDRPCALPEAGADPLTGAAPRSGPLLAPLTEPVGRMRDGTRKTSVTVLTDAGTTSGTETGTLPLPVPLASAGAPPSGAAADAAAAAAVCGRDDAAAAGAALEKKAAPLPLAAAADAPAEAADVEKPGALDDAPCLASAAFALNGNDQRGDATKAESECWCTGPAAGCGGNLGAWPACDGVRALSRRRMGCPG